MSRENESIKTRSKKENLVLLTKICDYNVALPIISIREGPSLK